MLRRRQSEGLGVKAGRLAGYLLGHPGELPRWLDDRLRSRWPLERRLPWFSWPAIRWLDDFLQPHHRVLEFGAGGSTLFFAARAASVVSLEPDPTWRARVAALAGPKVQLLDEPPGSPADLIVVDGADWQERPKRFAWAQQHVSPGGAVVLDDSWRYPELTPPGALRLAGIGPCRLGITETLIWPAPG